MGCKNYIFALLIFLLTSWSTELMAGITGTLSGTIRDKETGQVLPGASVKVEGTTSGAMADRNGRYIIHNLPAGQYDVSVSMIGYAKVTIQNVQINVDLVTELDFDLVTKVLPLNEVTITEKRDLIHPDITSSTYFISGKEINDKLPIDSFRDAISLLPGVAGDHLRGGRETDVVYMLDGLPIQSGLSREISSYFPNSSIVEMMVQTGGYSAEYGNATSGIVNVVSKDGRNQVEAEIKAYTDFFDTGLTGSDNTRRLELNVGGPLTLGFGGPVVNANYFVAADLNLSDTAFGDQMREAFDSPIFKNFNLNSKLSFDISNNTILSFQGLVSNWSWRKFDPQWQLNLQGLAENKHYSHRISASVTHTLSSKFFTSLRIARYGYKRQVEGADEESPNVVFDDPQDPKSLVVSGEQPWHEETRESVGVVKLDLVGQLRPNHLLKSGIEIQAYDIDSQSTRFDYFARIGDGQSLVLNRSSNNYDYSPKIYSAYIQDKIDYKGITANLGLRYDIFSPSVSINQESDEFQDLRIKLGAPPFARRSENSHTLAPRLGISIPLSEHERVHANYGWYYQMPSLYYFTLNGSGSLSGYLPILGNLELEPVKSVSAELSYKRLVSDDLLLVLTGFVKQFDNLIDTQTYVLPDSLVGANATTIGFSKYSNSAQGEASGFEVTLQKRFMRALSGRVSYTYMKAHGTSSTAEDEFNRTLEGASPSAGLQFPLSWDQRHSFIIDLDYSGRFIDFNVLYRLFSPLPFTTQGSDVPNNARLSWRNILDVKLKLKSHRLLGGTLSPFVEIRNVFNEQNVINQVDDSGVRAYRLFDPINSDHGRRLRVGLAMEF